MLIGIVLLVICWAGQVSSNDGEINRILHLEGEDTALRNCARRCVDTAFCKSWFFQPSRSVNGSAQCALLSSHWHDQIILNPVLLRSDAHSCYGILDFDSDTVRNVEYPDVDVSRSLPISRTSYSNSSFTTRIIDEFPHIVLAPTIRHHFIPRFDHINDSCALSLIPISFSISLWVWIRGPASNMQAVFSTHSAASKMSHITSQVLPSILLHLPRHPDKFFFSFSRNPLDSDDFVGLWAGKVKYREWIHLAITVDEQFVARMYQNGVLLDYLRLSQPPKSLSGFMKTKNMPLSKEKRIRSMSVQCGSFGTNRSNTIVSMDRLRVRSDMANTSQCTEVVGAMSPSVVLALGDTGIGHQRMRGLLRQFYIVHHKIWNQSEIRAIYEREKRAAAASEDYIAEDLFQQLSQSMLQESKHSQSEASEVSVFRSLRCQRCLLYPAEEVIVDAGNRNNVSWRMRLQWKCGKSLQNRSSSTPSPLSAPPSTLHAKSLFVRIFESLEKQVPQTRMLHQGSARLARDIGHAEASDADNDDFDEVVLTSSSAQLLEDAENLQTNMSIGLELRGNLLRLGSEKNLYFNVTVVGIDTDKGKNFMAQWWDTWHLKRKRAQVRCLYAVARDAIRYSYSNKHREVKSPVRQAVRGNELPKMEDVRQVCRMVPSVLFTALFLADDLRATAIDSTAKIFPGAATHEAAHSLSQPLSLLLAQHVHYLSQIDGNYPSLQLRQLRNANGSRAYPTKTKSVTERIPVTSALADRLAQNDADVQSMGGILPMLFSTPSYPMRRSQALPPTSSGNPSTLPRSDTGGVSAEDVCVEAVIKSLQLQQMTSPSSMPTLSRSDEDTSDPPLLHWLQNASSSSSSSDQPPHASRTWKPLHLIEELSRLLWQETSLGPLCAAFQLHEPSNSHLLSMLGSGLVENPPGGSHSGDASSATGVVIQRDGEVRIGEDAALAQLATSSTTSTTTIGAAGEGQTPPPPPPTRYTMYPLVAAAYNISALAERVLSTIRARRFPSRATRKRLARSRVVLFPYESLSTVLHRLSPIPDGAVDSTVPTTGSPVRSAVDPTGPFHSSASREASIARTSTTTAAASTGCDRWCALETALLTPTTVYVGEVFARRLSGVYPLHVVRPSYSWMTSLFSFTTASSSLSSSSSVVDAFSSSAQARQRLHTEADALQLQDADAMVWLGKQHYWGFNGVPRNETVAEAWFTQAAALGHAEGLHTLALCQLHRLRDFVHDQLRRRRTRTSSSTIIDPDDDGDAEARQEADEDEIIRGVERALGYLQRAAEHPRRPFAPSLLVLGNHYIHNLLVIEGLSDFFRPARLALLLHRSRTSTPHNNDNSDNNNDEEEEEGQRNESNNIDNDNNNNDNNVHNNNNIHDNNNNNHSSLSLWRWRRHVTRGLHYITAAAELALLKRPVSVMHNTTSASSRSVRDAVASIGATTAGGESLTEALFALSSTLLDDFEPIQRQLRRAFGAAPPPSSRNARSESSFPSWKGDAEEDEEDGSARLGELLADADRRTLAVMMLLRGVTDAHVYSLKVLTHLLRDKRSWLYRSSSSPPSHDGDDENEQVWKELYRALQHGRATPTTPAASSSSSSSSFSSSSSSTSTPAGADVHSAPDIEQKREQVEEENEERMWREEANGLLARWFELLHLPALSDPHDNATDADASSTPPSSLLRQVFCQHVDVPALQDERVYLAPTVWLPTITTTSPAASSRETHPHHSHQQQEDNRAGAATAMTSTSKSMSSSLCVPLASLSSSSVELPQQQQGPALAAFVTETREALQYRLVRRMADFAPRIRELYQTAMQVSDRASEAARAVAYLEEAADLGHDESALQVVHFYEESIATAAVTATAATKTQPSQDHPDHHNHPPPDQQQQQEQKPEQQKTFDLVDAARGSTKQRETSLLEQISLFVRSVFFPSTTSDIIHLHHHHHHTGNRDETRRCSHRSEEGDRVDGELDAPEPRAEEMTLVWRDRLLHRLLTLATQRRSTTAHVRYSLLSFYFASSSSIIEARGVAGTEDGGPDPTRDVSSDSPSPSSPSSSSSSSRMRMMDRLHAASRLEASVARGAAAASPEAVCALAETCLALWHEFALSLLRVCLVPHHEYPRGVGVGGNDDGNDACAQRTAHVAEAVGWLDADSVLATCLAPPVSVISDIHGTSDTTEVSLGEFLLTLQRQGNRRSSSSSPSSSSSSSPSSPPAQVNEERERPESTRGRRMYAPALRRWTSLCWRIYCRLRLSSLDETNTPSSSSSLPELRREVVALLEDVVDGLRPFWMLGQSVHRVHVRQRSLALLALRLEGGLFADAASFWSTAGLAPLALWTYSFGSEATALGHVVVIGADWALRQHRPWGDVLRGLGVMAGVIGASLVLVMGVGWIAWRMFGAHVDAVMVAD